MFFFSLECVLSSVFYSSSSNGKQNGDKRGKNVCLMKKKKPDLMRHRRRNWRDVHALLAVVSLSLSLSPSAVVVVVDDGDSGTATQHGSVSPLIPHRGAVMKSLATSAACSGSFPCCCGSLT